MQLEGIHTPVITPMHGNREINEAGWAEMIGHLIELGTHGLVLGGTTGENYALTPEERIRQFQYGNFFGPECIALYETCVLRRDYDTGRRIMKALLPVMDYITTPFGGMKLSGFGGRDNGMEAFEQYLETKTIWIDLSDCEIDAELE